MIEHNSSASFEMVLPNEEKSLPKKRNRYKIAQWKKYYFLIKMSKVTLVFISTFMSYNLTTLQQF